MRGNDCEATRRDPVVAIALDDLLEFRTYLSGGSEPLTCANLRVSSRSLKNAPIYPSVLDNDPGVAAARGPADN